jgi:general secretion pathway protein J
MKGNGFTLLEVLISIMILATVLSTVFASYSGTFRIVGETESQAEIYHMARIALERMLEDLESVYVPANSDSSEEADMNESDDRTYEFQGEDEELDGQSADTMGFPSRAQLVFDEEEQQWGIVGIRYFAEKDENSGNLTFFRDERSFLEESGDEVHKGLPLCEDLASVEFKYVDRDGEELDIWAPEDGTPSMVSISLGFVNPSNPETPLIFATNVALPTRKAEGVDEE